MSAREEKKARLIARLKAWKAEFDAISEDACSTDFQVLVEPHVIQFIGRRNKTTLDVSLAEETKIT